MATVKTTTGNIYSTGALDEIVERAAIQQFEKNTYFLDMGEQRDLTTGNNKYNFNLADAMAFTIGDATLTEGTTPDGVAFQMTQVEVALAQYGAFAELSDVVLADSPVDAVEQAGFELGRRLAELTDAKIQDVLDAGTNVFFGGDATSRVTLNAADVFDAQDLAKAFSLLKANAAPTFNGEGYVAVMHPHVIKDLFADSGVGSFVDVNKYTENAGKIFNGEIGKLFGVRVIESANIQIYTDGGSGDIDAYPTFVMGQNAYGVVTGQNFSTMVKLPGSEGSADPLDQRGSVGVKIRFGSAILKQASLYRVETSSSLGTNA